MMNPRMMSPRKRMDMEGSGPTMMAKGGPKRMAKGYKKGGGVTRGDGMCTKGHTKGKTV
jgi:hypothetical protein